MPDKPLEGADATEVLKWLRGTPTRLEMYRLTGQVMTAASKVVHGSLAILRNEPVAALEHLQESLDALETAIRLMPEISDDVYAELEHQAAEAENG